MKTFIALFALILSFSAPITAQFSLQPSVGIAIPTGDFAETNPDNADVESEFAAIGLHLNLGLRYDITQSIGIAINISGNANPLDTEALENYFKNESGGSGWVVAEETYGTGFILIGPSLAYKSEQLGISLQPGIGLGVLTDFYTTVDNSPVLFSSLSGEQGSGFAWGGTLSTTAYLSENIGLSFDIRYMSSTIERNTTSMTTVAGLIPVYDDNTYDFVASVLGLGVGLWVGF